MGELRIRGKHSKVHPVFTEGCFTCKVASQHVAPSVYNPEVADGNRRDAQLHKDRAAYKRMRDDGLQPNNVDGSAELEQRVNDQIELDYKIPIPPKDLPRVKEIQAEIAMNAVSLSVNS